MKPYTIESEEASIVFVGSFNPAIFHPQWFVRNDLIPQDDIEGANIEIVHNDISKFSLEWLGIDVLRNKFVARTNDPSKFSPLKDLMISVFSILKHMPITQMGMNLISTYKIDEEANWHAIGDCLVPKSIWEKTLPKRIGMTSLTVKSPRTDSLEGFINVIVNPSMTGLFGVVFNVNSHVEIQKEGRATYDVPAILMENWDSALILAKEIGENTLMEALEI